MKKKVLSVICAVVLSMSLTACGFMEMLGDMAGFSNKWVDSDLIGAVPADKEFSEKNDFAAAANKEWKKEIGDNYTGTFQEVLDSVIEKKKRMVTDETIEGKTAESLRTYYALASNWDNRAKDGVEPLRPYIEDIESISSVDEMYDFIADPVRNPLLLGPVSTGSELVMHSEKYSDKYTFFFSIPGIVPSDIDGSNALEEYEKYSDKSIYILDKLGYSTEESKTHVSNSAAWAKQLSGYENMPAVKKIDDITYPRDKVIKMAGDFPFEKILKGWGLSDISYIAISPNLTKKLSRACKEKNLEEIKSFLIVNYCLEASEYLDRATYDEMKELDKPRLKEAEDTGETPEQLEDYLMFEQYIARTPMVGAMNQVYVENCFDEGTIDELTTITEDMLEGFEDIFSNEVWLSEEGKKACIEKLKAINIHIAIQDFETVDYGKLSLKSHEEGGSFLEAYFDSRRFELDHLSWLSGENYDRDYWDPMNQQLSTTVTNAMYSAQTNGIYIFAGILEAPVYSKDMTYEQKLGGLFTIVGHEITHGFDSNGSQYDKDGYNNPILSDDDLGKFNDKTSVVGAYYTTQSPFSGAGMILGPQIAAEATADMGGIKATLHLAKKESDFNYDQYFRSFASIWRTNVSVEAEKKSIENDPHPLAFYRINVGLQQFEEFYDTYKVKEGDGMYLAPERRINVW